MIVIMPSPVALFLMSCFRSLIYTLGNIIVFFVLIGIYVSLFLLVFPWFSFLVLYLVQWRGFTHLYLFSPFTCTSLYNLFTYHTNSFFCFTSLYDFFNSLYDLLVFLIWACFVPHLVRLLLLGLRIIIGHSTLSVYIYLK